MGMGRKERKELVAATISQLEEVLPASGKPEELVKLTTAIVQSTKKLLEGTPEELITKSTATLSDFVVAARSIAKDPRSVDASTRQALSNSRKAVDALVRELNTWHDERQGGRKGSEDAEVVLNRIASETSIGAGLPRQNSANGDGAVPGRRGSVQTPEDGAKEKELRDELKKEQITLWKKTEPQQAPTQHGKPSDVLTTTTGDLKTGAKDLVEVASQKNPSPAVLLEPALQVTKSVSILLDMVDSLFINRYPMRSQVHGFCCTLIENALTYGSQSRTDDLSSLRTITTEVPALLSAAEVMITQSHKRAQDMEGQKKMSIQRSSDLQLLDAPAQGVMGVKKRGPPPKPPGAVEKPKEEADFEIICVLCTNVAINQEDKKPMPKGTEVPLLAYSSTSILDVKRMLHTRTGLPRDHIEIKMQGDDVLPDSTRVKPNNPVPYFVFNIHEPSDKELQEIRKIEKIKNRPKLEELDWSRFSGPVAIALYDYDALGEEGNLNFDEGDIIEITEKSHDGWWTGRVEDTVGDFPASFVEEIEIPKTKEEKKRLAQRFSKTPQDKLHVVDDDEGRASPVSKKFRKFQSIPEPNNSPSSKPKFDRRTSEPVFSQTEQQQGRKDKKKLSLFKKRGTSQYNPLHEETGDKQKSPLISDRRKKKVPWEEAIAECESPEPHQKPLIRPLSASPKPVRKQMGGNIAEGSAKVVRPRRPPPPVPKPHATHVAVDTEELARNVTEDLSPEREDAKKKPSNSNSRSSPAGSSSSKSPELQPVIFEPENPAGSPLSPKKSESMEELLKNLEEFDEVISSQNGPESPENEERERDFATIPRSELPVPKKAPGIKISEEGSLQSRSLSNTPEATRKTKPEIPLRPKLVQNGFSHSQPDEPTQSKPTAPPRRKRKTSQKMKDRMGVFEGLESGGETPADSKPPPPSGKPVYLARKSASPPPKPERDEKKRLRSRLEVMAERQASSSAPVSRNASPDIGEDKPTKENSTSNELLNARPPAPAKRSPLSIPPSNLLYTAARQCISYLSDEDRVISDRLFQSSASSGRRVEVWLNVLDRGEAPDLSSIHDTASATAMLKALLSNNRLGPLVNYPLAKAMCELVKSTSPVSVLGSQLEKLSAEHRGLLKELLRLFGLVINHSHKNKTEVSDINRMFGALMFDRMPPAQTEPLMAYLISTCELLIAS